MTDDATRKNAYQVLGVPQNADLLAIRRAFKKLAIKHHPDAVPVEQKQEAVCVFSRINEAHEILRDSDKRRQYDQLLERGIVPDLGQEIGAQARFEGLADIIGEIRSLDLDVEPSHILLARVDKTLRDELLLPNLIKGDRLKERVVDALPFKTAIIEKWEQPPGKMTEGCLIVTEIRLVLLFKFEDVHHEGNTRRRDVHFRAFSVPYAAMTDLVVHEVGRAFTSYCLQVVDEDKNKFLLMFERRPRLERLFLVANAYKLPLRISARADLWSEYWDAIIGGFTPVMLWCLPFLFVTMCKLCCDPANPDSYDMSKQHWPEIRGWLDDHFVTTLVIYAVPLALGLLIRKVYISWSTGRAEHVFGGLEVDYARGVPKYQADVDVAPEQQAPKSQPVPPPLSGTKLAPASAVAWGEDGDAHQLAHRDAPGTVLILEMPESVRLAADVPCFGLGHQAVDSLAASGNLESCPRCGATRSFSMGTTACANCGDELGGT